MKKKLPLLLLLFLVCILSISAISATENTANNDVIGADNNKENNLEINIPDDNVSTGNENFELSLEQNNNDELKDSGELNFNDLNRIINGNSNSTIYLSNNYKYDEDSDTDFVNGIIIDRDLMIYGNGITLNGDKKARIFNVIDFNLNVSFYDIHFINGHSSNGCGGAIHGGTSYNCNFNDNYAYDGGALCSGTAYNCTFKDNEAEHNGGAIFDGNAYNCTFTENEAVSGGAMSDSYAYNSTFTENEADKGGAMYGGVAFNSTFTKNEAEKGGAMYESVADECFFKKNHADDGGGAMYKGEAFYCDFVSNSARDDGGAMYRGNAYACTFTENEAAYEDERYAVYEYYNGGAIYDGNAYDCTFIENFANDGGAMYDGSARNCIFKENLAFHSGGAVNDVDAYYCTFTENRAHERNGGGMNNGNAYHCIFKKNSLGSFSGYGRALADSNAYNCTLKDHPGDSGAMVGGKAALCKFNGDPIDDVDIIHPAIHVSDHVLTYNSGEKLEFDLIANNILLDGFNLTIKIYKDNQLYTTVYGLSGEGWIVDLEPGDYTADLMLTDFPKEKSSFANITVRSTFADLNTTINGNNNSTIYLSNNDYFKFDIASDVELINGIIINRDLTIYGNGTTINGDAITRIFKVEDNVNVKFYNINFINGKAVDGGAIYGGNAYNCFFRENTAEKDGGAIYGGNAVNCTFNFNAAERDGGAIYLGNATDCTFNINTAEKDGGAITQGNAYNSTFIQNHADNLGGAIHLGNAAGCTFTSNTAGTGGAISQGNVYNSTFILNRADNVGGAIYLGNATDCTFTNSTSETGGVMYGGNAKNCTFTKNKAYAFGGAIYGGNVIDCTFAKNKADRGGAIYQGNANNCTFTDNTAEKDGGAIFKGDAINCTFIGNTAHHGGAMNCEDINRNYTAEGCTFIGNSADGGGATYFVDVFNCIFTNNTSTCDGGAVYKRAAVNCTFTGNTAERDGGAIFKGDAINCTFIGNSVQHQGGAMYEGTACLCIFNEDSTKDTKIIHPIINVLNYASTYNSGEKLKFNLTANDMVFDGFKTSIAIYKNGSLVKTASGLSGEGWIVDLGPGEYTAVLSLTDYPDEKSSNATINVSKGNTIIDISPINNAKVGQELTINYTTNSNGTVTIKVNGQKISGNKFTPTKVGSYVVSVEVAENDYYAATSNETAFTVKTNAVVVISPITNVVVGQEVTINYTTNSNGTVTIKVNGQKISGNKFTPTKVGSYNLTVEVAENDYYTAASNQTTFTAEKTDAVVEISPITNVVVGQEVTINYTTNSNGTVTIKVNGQKISGTKFTPTKEGIYNVSVEVAENDYYTAASNETAFTVEKISAMVVISPIANVVVGQEVTINYTTNSNGTVTIKVDGQKINGTKFTPTKEGSYNVTVKIAENDYYTEASNQTKFWVEKIDNYTADINIGEDSVTVILPEDINGKLTVKVGNEIFTVPVKNGVAVIPYDDLPAGENSITVTYRGDNKYAEKSFDFNVTVEPKVIITAKDLIKYYGSPDRFVVSIKDSEGRPIAGQIVYITLNGKTYDRTTDNAGMASIGVNLNSGNYTAAVKVNETELTASITVLSTVNGTNIVKIFRNATQYYVTARDSNGNYLPENTEIEFNINGVFYKRKVTGDKGLVKLNINLNPNTYIITAYNTVTGELTSNNITVLSRLTENKNITMYEKNGTKYTVRVLDETGKAVGAGEKVTFNINGVFYTRTTDANGYATINLNLNPGNYIITAMYGDSTVTNNIEILPRLVASDLVKKYGTPDQFKAQLLDGKGNPVVGEKITFNINGVLYNRPTDADGFAKLNINLMPGKYVITSSYGSFVCGNTVTVNG
ncbi:hypothetical protein [Methanobrevibacter sp.]|uniref:hypothetical protein n=1 Tax=Methanobrevibacter sp. TaxID=66852 RepID=UPI003890BE0C